MAEMVDPQQACHISKVYLSHQSSYVLFDTVNTINFIPAKMHSVRENGGRAEPHSGVTVKPRIVCGDDTANSGPLRHADGVQRPPG